MLITTPSQTLTQPYLQEPPNLNLVTPDDLLEILLLLQSLFQSVVDDTEKSDPRFLWTEAFRKDQELGHVWHGYCLLVQLGAFLYQIILGFAINQPVPVVETSIMIILCWQINKPWLHT